MNWMSATSLRIVLFIHRPHSLNISDRLDGVMISVLAKSAEGRGICCFSAKHAAFRTKSKDWSAQSQNNVSG